MPITTGEHACFLPLPPAPRRRSRVRLRDDRRPTRRRSPPARSRVQPAPPGPILSRSSGGGVTRLEVHKFGGTSLGDAGRIAACAAIGAGVAGRARVVLVASAMAGVTDRLVAAAAAAA